LLANLGCGGSTHPDWLNFDFRELTPDVLPHDLRTPLPLPDASCAAVYSSHVLEHFNRAQAPRFLRECWRVLRPGGILRLVVPDLETIARLYLENLQAALAGDAQAARQYDWMMLELFDQMVREESGGEMLHYWRQNPMPAEEFVMRRMGQEVREFCRAFRASPTPAAPVDASPAEEPSPAAITRFRASGELHRWMYDQFSLRELLRKVGFDQARKCAASESQIPGFNTYGFDLLADGSVRKPDSLFMEALKPVAGGATVPAP